jgi:hypothetical protein
VSESDSLEIYTIYDHPRDFPDYYVVTKALVGTNLSIVFGRAESLDEARDLIPEGLHWMPRWDGDDPVIVEVWL